MSNEREKQTVDNWQILGDAYDEKAHNTCCFCRCSLCGKDRTIRKAFLVHHAHVPKCQCQKRIRNGMSTQGYRARRFFQSVLNANLLVEKYGKIVRPEACELCGVSCKPDGHHDNYETANWLKVRWLCKRCHRLQH